MCGGTFLDASTHKPPHPRHSSPVVAESLHTDWKQLLHLRPRWTQMRECFQLAPTCFNLLKFSGLYSVASSLPTPLRLALVWGSPPSSMISQEDPSLGRRASGQMMPRDKTEVLVRNSARLGADWILDGIL